MSLAVSTSDRRNSKGDTGPKEPVLVQVRRALFDELAVVSHSQRLQIRRVGRTFAISLPLGFVSVAVLVVSDFQVGVDFPGTA
eukprot:CAMPEP_0202082112 /NCGR_PEP_ID=MMETSP0964-20121228/17797_1 /ASSEMBLY_ACC=CAM_ASM_000500 /TAXON_ID=4773 /ORGANISM="Schizochytrium aggregatum, Strain ATCC28209" /LENGTH=82 /DNA_ID=CAMNT_0048649731 /DNA_START=3 /DNA_END=247 /DNA_ORIENTATION=+